MGKAPASRPVCMADVQGESHPASACQDGAQRAEERRKGRGLWKRRVCVAFCPPGSVLETKKGARPLPAR